MAEESESGENLSKEELLSLIKKFNKKINELERSQLGTESSAEIKKIEGVKRKLQNAAARLSKRHAEIEEGELSEKQLKKEKALAPFKFAFSLRNIISFGIALAVAVFFYFWIGMFYAGLIFVILYLLLVVRKGEGFSKVLRYILILGLIIILVLSFYTVGEAGVGKRAWYSIGGDFSLAALTAKYNQISNMAKAKLYGYGDWTNPQAVETRAPVGVKITDIETTRDAFISNKDEIVIMANAKVYGLKEVSPKISFDCEIEDGAGKMIPAKEVEVSGKEGKEVSIPIGEDEIYQIRCTFNPLQISSSKQNEVKAVKIKASYSNFATRSNIVVYTLKGDVLRGIGDVDAFDYFNKQDSKNIGSDGIAIPHKEISAPVELWLNIPVKQPFIENVKYFVGLKLNHDPFWGGKLIKINYLRMIYPETLRVIKEKCTGFEESQFSQLKEFKENLLLKEEEINDANENIKKEKYDINNIKYFCDFQVAEAGDVPESSQIRVQISYDYEFSKTSTINLVTEEEYKGVQV